MMEALRPLSILPAIKCSTCGAEIEISSMGEHVCTSPVQEKKQGLSTEPLSSTAHNVNAGFRKPHGYSSMNPAATTKTGSAWGRTPRSASATSPATEVPRSMRSAPPRIDPAAANKPYIQRELLSPGGLPSTTVRSPTTPHTASKPHKPAMIRSMTSPAPRIYRPPSPKMSSNLDCAFPPFPVSRPSTSGSKSKTASPTTQGTEQSTLGAELHAEPESYVGPKSPRTTAGANVMQRMNSIAPGPFDARVRSSSDNVSLGNRSTTPKLQTDHTSRSIERAEPKSPVPTQDELRPRSPPVQTQQPQASTPAFVSVAPPPATNREGRPVPQRPVRPEPLDGFLVMLKNETEASARAAGLVDSKPTAHSIMQVGAGPQRLGVNDTIARRPSESGLHAKLSAVAPVLTTASSLPNHSELEPRNFTTLKQGVHSVPPISTTQNLARQHKIHSPSDSASSASSTRSFEQGSFRSDMSPPISATSSISMLSTTLDENSRDQDPSLAVPSLQVRHKASQPRPSPEESRQDVPQPSKVGAALQSGVLPSGPFHNHKHMDPPESPVVPSMQGLQPQPLRRPPAPQGPLPLTPGSSAPTAPEMSRERASTNRPSAKRPGTASKHHCRGCKEPITGKSVKAADGRLTGRWHKHCFVCRTCQSPFATADFYVINNDPYCEQHYHKLNNSLCAKCDRGIEGPYLDTQQGQKFHPECFTCLDCRKVLSDDYFEINGSVYCEQHAYTQLRRQEGLGPKRDMERRRTRLMMMGDHH